MSAPHPFSLRQWQYALAVAQELSFRRAAERCHVSQPALSAQIAELEGATGVRLFERDKKRVLVTAAGRELLARAARLIVEADGLLEASRRTSDPFAGTIKLGVIPTVAPYLLPELTPRLRHKLPRLTIVWREEKTETLASQLHAGVLDGAVVALESELGDVESQLIGKDPFVLATPPQHPLAQERSPAPSLALRSQPVLLLDDGHCFREQALAFCERARAPELEFRATSLSTLVQMVAGGAGITLLPAIALGTEARRAKIVIRRLATPPQRTLALVYRRSSAVLPALDQVAELARESHAKLLTR